MSLKRLLVPLLEGDADRNTLLQAVEVAELWQAHVTVMHSGGHLSELVSPESPQHSRFKPPLQVEARSLVAERMKAAQDEFETLATERGWSIADAPRTGLNCSMSFNARRGTVETAVQELAIYHDAIVFARDPSVSAKELVALGAIKAALENCGRPLLILARQLARPFATSVAIAWNGSIEGAHAVSAALPILKRAKSVHVITVATQKTASEQATPMQDYLSWHGIPCTVHTPARGGGSVGSTILREIESLGANLLVSGGYTHNRVRQAVLGGVTHDLLSQERVSLLLAK